MFLLLGYRSARHNASATVASIRRADLRIDRPAGCEREAQGEVNDASYFLKTRRNFSYKAELTEAHINGLVLSICDLNELKQEMKVRSEQTNKIGTSEKNKDAARRLDCVQNAC